MVRGAGACTLARRFAGANIACDVARRGGGAGATRMDAGRRSCAAHCASIERIAADLRPRLRRRRSGEAGKKKEKGKKHPRHEFTRY